MKIIAKTRTQISGYGIVQPDQIIDFDDRRIDGRIKANFNRADGREWETGKHEEKAAPSAKSADEAKKDLIKRTAERMGREALIAALDSAAVQYAMTENTNSLAKKYLRSIGQDVD